jgi:hypothetical protein
LASLEEQATRILAEIERLKPLHLSAVEAMETHRAIVSQPWFIEWLLSPKK